MDRRSSDVLWRRCVASLLVVATGAFAELQQPALIVAATITVLLFGLSVVGTVQDAITGWNAD